MSPEPNSTAKGPLAGIAILDISQGWAGPGATMLLGDQGADVIKVEPLQGDQAREYFANTPIEGEERAFLAINRSKRGIALNLKTTMGKEVLLKLVRKSDVFLQNFRPGVAERLDIGYDSLRKIRPELIYVSMTPYGRQGPLAAQRAYDVVLQSLGGAMRFSGPEAVPVVSGIWVSDCSTMIMLAYAITLALLARERYGHGQQIDTTLFFQTLFMQFPDLVCSQSELGKPTNDDFQEKLWCYLSPCRCRDGKYLVVVAMTNEQWQSLCNILDLTAMADDVRFGSPLDRFRQGDHIHAELQKAFLTREQAEWVDVLTSADVPCSPVLRRDEVLIHPQVTDNHMGVDIDHPRAGPVRMLNLPFTLSVDSGGIQRPSPLLGQHTREVLLDLGYTQDDITAMVNSGVVNIGLSPS